MRSSFIALLATLSIAVAGCIPSLNALYTKETTVFKSELLGRWEAVSGNGKQRLQFSASESGSGGYELVHVDKQGEKATFRAHLTEIEGTLFLDVFPLSPNQPVNEEFEDVNVWYRLHLVPAHTFLRVDQINPTLKLSGLNAQWLEGVLRSQPEALSHDLSDRDRGEGKRFPVLTASTAELRAFMAEYATNPRAFLDPTEFRKPDGQAEE